jgi:hypothetical protein
LPAPVISRADSGVPLRADGRHDGRDGVRVHRLAKALSGLRELGPASEGRPRPLQAVHESPIEALLAHALRFSCRDSTMRSDAIRHFWFVASVATSTPLLLSERAGSKQKPREPREVRLRATGVRASSSVATPFLPAGISPNRQSSDRAARSSAASLCVVRHPTYKAAENTGADRSRPDYRRIIDPIVTRRITFHEPPQRLAQISGFDMEGAGLVGNRCPCAIPALLLVSQVPSLSPDEPPTTNPVAQTLGAGMPGVGVDLCGVAPSADVLLLLFLEKLDVSNGLLTANAIACVRPAARLTLRSRRDRSVNVGSQRLPRPLNANDTTAQALGSLTLPVYGVPRTYPFDSYQALPKISIGTPPYTNDVAIEPYADPGVSGFHWRYATLDLGGGCF